MEAKLVGEWRRPRNTAAHQKGGIHDDETATGLGFRGGTVAGSIHMEQFPPLLEAVFGESWWRHGSLSLYFRSATLDREPVRCFVSEPEQIDGLLRAEVWMENGQGDTVLSGSAACGGQDRRSELRSRLAQLREPAELRILEDMNLGDTSGQVPTRLGEDRVDRQLAVITEPLDCYGSPERFGGRVLPMTAVVGIFDPAEQVLARAARLPFVGLYGAIEIEFVNGPVFSETDYDASGTIVGLSDSPKTEVLWRDLVLTKAGEPVARMLKMDRLLKASSPLWQDAMPAS